MSITSNRSRKEKDLAYKISLLKGRQVHYRKSWLDCDAKISLLIANLNALTDKRMANSCRRVKRRGDGYAC